MCMRRISEKWCCVTLRKSEIIQIGNYLKIDNIIPSHIKSLTDVLEEMGADIEIHSDYLIIDSQKQLKATNIKTLH